MIPVKLTVRNFMCYRDNVPPLKFDGIRLACLSGDNGNGKSALIDAMTWALWGKARASSDDDLIHATQMEMEVDFKFTVGQQLYRIVRKHSRPKRRGSTGQSALEFQIAAGDGFKAISGEGKTQTQKKIIDVLHMDYDTFVNSAYLRQGHADEFTRQAPTKRKEVLGNILGLSLYDKLEGQAKNQAKKQEAEKALLENGIREVSDEIARKPAYEAELAQAQNELSRLEETTREKEAILNELRQEKETLQSKKTQLDELEARLNNTVKDLARWDDQARQLYLRLKEYEEIIGRSATIEKGYLQFTEAKKTNEELDKKLSQSAKLEKKKIELEKKIQTELNTLKTEHAVTLSKINELDIRTQKLPVLKNHFNQLQTQIRRLAEPEETLKQKEQAIQKLQAQVNHLESEKNRLEREISELAEKLDLLASQTEGKCPLCETELTREGLKLIETKYTNEKQSKSDLLKSYQAGQAQKQTELESLQKEMSQLESRLNQEKMKFQSQESVIKKEITEAEEANQQLSELEKTLEDIEQHLAKRDFAVAEQEALTAIETELASLGYDSGRHEQVRQQLHYWEHYDQDKRRLEEAVKRIQQEREAVARAEEAAQGLRQSLEIDNQKKEATTAELAQLPQLLSTLDKAEAEHRNLTSLRNWAQETVGSAKAKIQRCVELEKKKQEKEDRLKQAAREEDIYQELAKAFGKGGIQALLIEMALPEIEVEANRLLGRMTDNRMHVKFETQRETKKGTVQETLDINIADELGTRNYEMFSGGEAFRINLAIRIALSRLLAKRAGAPLPTLIIDEGFGTQDSTGMEKIKEAINSIQDDFSMILVITHMEELRDTFPTRIDVIKTAEGSTISVS